MCSLLTLLSSVGFIGLSLVITMLKGPREKRWIGWSGGTKLRKDDVAKPKVPSPEDGQETVRVEEKRAETGAGGEEDNRR